MKKILLILLLIGPLLGVAQKDSTTKTFPEKTQEREVFEVVGEKMPAYPGGYEEMQKFINKHLEYPDSAAKHKKQGRVYVECVVELDSSLSNVKVVKTFDTECGEEAVRIVKMMRWIPAQQRGKPVKVKMRIPINFKLD